MIELNAREEAKPSTMTTCFDAFERAAQRYGQQDFAHIPAQACAQYSDSAITWQYRAAHAAVVDLAGQYSASGLKLGRRLALVLENRAEFFLHFLALNSLGVSVVPVHPQFSAKEIAFLIDHSDCVAIVALPIHHPLLAKAVSQLERPLSCVAPDKLDALPDFRRDDSAGKPDIDTEAAILFTSGTTGKPKGCVLTNRYFDSWGRWYASLDGFISLRPGKERLLTPLPLNHQNAMACSLMGMIHSGGCIIQLDRFHSSSWWDTVRESRATALHYLGVMPAMLLNMTPSPDDDFSGQIRFGLGAGVDPKHHLAFEKRFGFPLVEGWAMTETGGTACVMAHRDPRHVGERCIGKPPATLEFRLVDEKGNDATSGAPGELLVRTAGGKPRLNFFKEYYRDAAATAEAWDCGYFHTGDVVRQGEDGSLFFVDRRKNVIRRSGENISAVEVEAALLPLPGVAACAVTAIHDEFRGEEVMALVVVADGFDEGLALAGDIARECRETLAYFKVPGHIGFVSQLPLGATQKIKRGEIKELTELVLGTERHFDLCHLKKPIKSREVSK